MLELGGFLYRFENSCNAHCLEVLTRGEGIPISTILVLLLEHRVPFHNFKEASQRELFKSSSFTLPPDLLIQLKARSKILPEIYGPICIR